MPNAAVLQFRYQADLHRSHLLLAAYNVPEIHTILQQLSMMLLAL